VAVFPPSPISPAEFLEGYVTAFVAEWGIPESLAGVDLDLGVRLDGEGGGEWLYSLCDGSLDVYPGSREDADITLIQSVDDWRGTLWEDRGGIVVERALALFRNGGLPALGGVLAGALGTGTTPAAPDRGLFERLAALGGVMRTVITGGPAGDWATAVKFGPGEIPDEATATISVHHDDVVALARREISPLEAFLAGRVSVAGDMLLVMQLQAIAMSAAGEAGREGP
jgi:hypothetical protein